MDILHVKCGPVTVSNVGTTELGVINLFGQMAVLNLEIAVTTQALNAFIIQLQDHPEGEFYNYLGGTDFDSAVNSNMLFATTTGPHELPAASKAHVIVRTHAAYAAKLLATAAVAGAIVTVRGLVRQEE